MGVLAGGSLIAGDAMFNIIKPTHARIFEDRDAMLDSVYPHQAHTV